MSTNLNIALLETKKNALLKKQKNLQNERKELEKKILLKYGNQIEDIKDKANFLNLFYLKVKDFKGEDEDVETFKENRNKEEELKKEILENKEKLTEQKESQAKEQTIEDLVMVKLENVANTLDVILKTLFTVANEFKLQTIPFSYVFQWRTAENIAGVPTKKYICTVFICPYCGAPFNQLSDEELNSIKKLRYDGKNDKVKILEGEELDKIEKIRNKLNPYSSVIEKNDLWEKVKKIFIYSSLVFSIISLAFDSFIKMYKIAGNITTIVDMVGSLRDSSEEDNATLFDELSTLFGDLKDIKELFNGLKTNTDELIEKIKKKPDKQIILARLKDEIFQLRDLLMLKNDPDDTRETLFELYKNKILGTTDNATFNYCYKCGLWVCSGHFNQQKHICDFCTGISFKDNKNSNDDKFVFTKGKPT